MKFQFEARDKSKLPFPKHKTTHKIQYVRMSQDTMVIQHGIPRTSLSTANVLFAKALSTVRQGSCMAGTGQGRMAAVLRRGTLALLVSMTGTKVVFASSRSAASQLHCFQVLSPNSNKREGGAGGLGWQCCQLHGI